MIGGQVGIIFVGNQAFSIKPINGTQWAICVVIAFLSLPAAVLIRCIPDPFVGACWDKLVIFFAPVMRGLESVWRAIPRREKKEKKPTDEEKGKATASP